MSELCERCGERPWNRRKDGVALCRACENQPAEPTDEQLENVALALGLPYLPPRMRPPYWRESMLNLHRLVQRALDGDAAAERTLAALLAVFGRDEVPA